MRDCLRQTGASWSYVHLAARQMRQRHMTWEPCRVKDSLRHANKSLLWIPSGDALSLFRSRQLLSLAVTHVSRTHCILHCTVTVCQLISLLQCLLSVCAKLSLQCSNTAIYTSDSYSQFICVVTNLHTVAMAVHSYVLKGSHRNPFPSSRSRRFLGMNGWLSSRVSLFL